MERHMCLSGGVPDRRRGGSGGGGTKRARKPTSKSSDVSCQVVTCIHPAGLAGVMLSSGRTHFCRCLATGHGHLCPVAVELSGHAQITRHQPCNLRLQLCFSRASHTAPTTQLPIDTVSSRLLRLSLASRTRASSATLFAGHTQIRLWWPNANEPGNALTNSPRNITQTRQLDSS